MKANTCLILCTSVRIRANGRLSGKLACFGHGWAKKKKKNSKKNIVAYTRWLQPLSACIIQRLSLLLCSSVVDRPESERNMHR